MAGTTAIAGLDGHSVSISVSAKNKDADKFITDFLTSTDYSGRLYLDAPLSLPGVYSGLKGCSDYFYRKADKEVGAMSPMFLGGLTARAMKLKAELSVCGIEAVEAYPKLMAKRLALPSVQYKKEKKYIPEMAGIVANHFHLKLPSLSSWHEVDAILALCIGLLPDVKAYGDPTEGLIFGYPFPQLRILTAP